MAEIQIYLNERGLMIAPTATVREALRLGLPDLESAVADGTAVVTDGRGLPVALDAALFAGAILRAARSARRAEADDGGG